MLHLPQGFKLMHNFKSKMQSHMVGRFSVHVCFSVALSLCMFDKKKQKLCILLACLHYRGNISTA